MPLKYRTQIKPICCLTFIIGFPANQVFFTNQSFLYVIFLYSFHFSDFADKKFLLPLEESDKTRLTLYLSLTSQDFSQWCFFRHFTKRWFLLVLFAFLASGGRHLFFFTDFLATKITAHLIVFEESFFCILIHTLFFPHFAVVSHGFQLCVRGFKLWHLSVHHCNVKFVTWNTPF